MSAGLWGRAVAALALLGVSAVAVARPVEAQTPTVRLVSQNLTVPVGGPLSLVLDKGAASPAATQLNVTVNGPLDPARAGLRAALAGAIDAPTVGSVTDAVADLPHDAAGRLVVTIPTVVRRADKRADNVRLPTTGLYAVRVDLRTDRNEVLSRFTTFVVRVDDALLAEPPYPVAVVLTADSPPALQPDGSTSVDSPARQRLQTLTQVLTRNATAPLSLVLRPTLLDGLGRSGLAADDKLVADLAGAVGDRTVVATTRDRVDPASLVAANLAGDLAGQLRSGEDVLVAALGAVEPQRATWVGEGVVDPASLTQLRSLGARQVVLPEGALQPNPAAPVDTTATIDAGDGGAPLVVAAVDAQLAAGLEPGPDPVLSAYRLAAELAAMDLDAGDRRGTRGVVLLPPAGWQPDAAFLGTFLDVLGSTPLLRPSGLEDWFTLVRPATAPDGTSVTRSLAPVPVPDLAPQARAVGLSRYGTAVYGSMLASTAASTLRTDSEALLTTSLSADLDAPGRAAYVAAVDARLAVLRGAVDPVAKRRITIAGRNSEIPITLHSKLDVPITVKLRLSSAKLSFPEGDQTVLLEGTEQLRIPVEARASGTFPMLVQVLTPVGDAQVAPPTQLTVQVSAFSGLGIVLIVGLGLVLATWWVHYVRTTRRSKRAAASAERHPTSHQPPAAAPS